ncbi:SAM-dependent methyltransferase, partial [Streptomyces sp. NPDC086077]
FETRDPSRRAWEEWTREKSYRVTEIPGIGSIESWVQLIELSRPLVTFRWTYRFAVDGQVLTSDSTLRFRERDEVAKDLYALGYVVDGVRDAPDRPGKEFVFLARRP